MLRRIHDPDKGASFVEYAAVIALVGIIIASLLVSGIPRQISEEIAGAVDEALNTESTDLSGGGPGAPGGTGAPESSGGASGSPGGEGAGDVEEVPGSGLPGPGDVGAAPYDPEEHTGGVTPAVWNGGDEFTAQQTLSWGEVLEWGSGGNPLFTFEDHGDYNWYCGEIFLSVCYFGGGLAQGANEAAEDAEHTLCHLRFRCTEEEAKEAWAETGRGVQNLVTDPKGSLEGMWDGLWATPEENREDLNGQGAFWKDSGYWVPQMMGAPLRAFRFFGDNGRSSDRDGDGRSRDGSDCSNSFTSGTLVVLADGTAKPIELI